MEKDGIIYGYDNKVYRINQKNNDVIEVEYQKELVIIKNAGLQKEKEVHNEKIIFHISDIGVKLFLNKNDCFKTAQQLLMDNCYTDYKHNLIKRIKDEEVLEKKKLEEIKKYAPGKEMSSEEIEKKLTEYEDCVFSQRQEEEFYKKETVSYFARIDIQSEYYGKQYYGGRYYISKELMPDSYGSIVIDGRSYTGIHKKNNDGTTIVHWTSPLGNLYYNNNNNVSNELESYGATYKNKAMLKRSFVFNPLKYYNTYIMNKSLYAEGTVDEFLLKILMEKKQSDKLTDIIYTIQSNQNQIIRTDKHESFVVQGCAGSGKTMIMLHRISYLKTNNMLPNYSRIKIITPNKLFSEFISNLSHDLYIQNIQQITISNYYSLLNLKYLKMYNNLDSIKEFFKKKNNDFKIKFEAKKMIDENDSFGDILSILYSKEIFEYINEEYNRIILEILEDIKNLHIENIGSKRNSKIFERFIYITDDIIKNKNENILNLKESIKIKTKNLNKKKEEYEEVYNKNIKSQNFFNKIIELIGNNKNEQEYVKKQLNSLKEEMIELEKQINTLKNDMKLHKKEINEINVVRENLLNNYYFTIDLYDKILEKIEYKFNIKFIKDKFTRVQLLILLYINYMHFGSLNNYDELLCFDEAQDYNVIEYQIIQLVNKYSVMNLYGDINQSFYVKGIKSWEQLDNVLSLKKYTLNENYRNSTQIVEFCNKEFNFNFTPMGITGKEVEYINYEQMLDVIKRKIEEKRKIVIIASNKSELDSINNKIKSEFVLYLTVGNVKGIEYDTVIVKQDKMSNIEKYISYTRALNELYILNE